MSTPARFLILLLAILWLGSCKNDPATTGTPANAPTEVGTAAPSGTKTYTVTEGIVSWAGKNDVSNSQHNGTIQIQEGTLTLTDGQLTAGSINLDMNSIFVQDLKDPGEKTDLESHLKDADFFETNKYPTGTFTFTESFKSTNPGFNAVVPGQLKLKDKTHNVNIPVNLTFNGEELSINSATFIIDRTKWDINFRSGILNTAKDKLISDNVPIQLSLKAKAN